MKTPYYRFDLVKVRENYSLIAQNLPYCDVFYSTKANSEVGILDFLSEIASGFEICSVKEAEYLYQSGFDMCRVLYGLPIKDEKDIEYLYGLGIRYFIFASVRELQKLVLFAPRANKVLRMAVSHFSPKSIDYGFMPNEIDQKVIEQTDGFHFHISNCKIDEHRKALKDVGGLLDQYLLHEKSVNIGGSYYTASDGFFAMLNEELVGMKSKYQLRLIAEPGAAIIGSAGELYTGVLWVEEKENFTDVYIDAGLSTGIYCVPERIVNMSTGSSPRRRIYRFFDNTCLKNMLFKKICLFEVAEGDILKFINYGAYSTCYINKFHNQYPPEIEFVI